MRARSKISLILLAATIAFLFMPTADGNATENRANIYYDNTKMRYFFYIQTRDNNILSSLPRYYYNIHKSGIPSIYLEIPPYNKAGKLLKPFITPLSFQNLILDFSELREPRNVFFLVAYQTTEDHVRSIHIDARVNLNKSLFYYLDNSYVLHIPNKEDQDSGHFITVYLGGVFTEDEAGKLDASVSCAPTSQCPNSPVLHYQEGALFELSNVPRTPIRLRLTGRDRAYVVDLYPFLRGAEENLVRYVVQKQALSAP